MGQAWDNIYFSDLVQQPWDVEVACVSQLDSAPTLKSNSDWIDSKLLLIIGVPLTRKWHVAPESDIA